VGDERSALQDLIRRGRLRQAWNLLVHAASFAVVVAMAGAIVLLVVGAQILNWYWIALLFVGGLAAAAYRSRGKLLSPYQTAQLIDHRLDLKDTLSTAYYFSQHPERAGAEDFVEPQREAAEQAARSADIERGVPFLMPRTAYVNLALVAVAFGMFGLRYGIHRSLDLGSPLVHINFDGLFGASSQVADAKHGQGPADADGRKPGAPQDPWQAKTNDMDPRNDAALQSVGDPDPNTASTSPDGSAKADAKTTQQMPPGSNPLDSGEKGESSLPSDASANPSAGAEQKNRQQQGGSKEGKDADQSGSSSENPSLASKLRDAISNLMAKMKPQSRPGGGKPNDSSQSSSTRPSQNGEKQEGEPKSPGQEQAEANANAQSEGDQQQGGTQQASQGKSEGRSNNQPNSPDGKSGIGKQDGDKAAREAAELAAMGKISEIIGKRAANIQGEVMVEVSSGKQQLKTQYSQQNAAHSDAGGEINRDEVPLAYQQYVQQYFAQVRKLPAPKSKAAPDAKPPVAPDGKPDMKSKTTPSSVP
jgi:hypothetical protein